MWCEIKSDIEIMTKESHLAMSGVVRHERLNI